MRAPLAGSRRNETHRVVVGARRRSACAVGRERERGGACQPADGVQPASVAVAQAAGPSGSCVSTPGRHVALERRSACRRSRRRRARCRRARSRSPTGPSRPVTGRAVGAVRAQAARRRRRAASGARWPRRARTRAASRPMPPRDVDEAPVGRDRDGVGAAERLARWSSPSSGVEAMQPATPVELDERAVRLAREARHGARPRRTPRRRAGCRARRRSPRRPRARARRRSRPAPPRRGIRRRG